MTVNERLFACGVYGEWQQAALKRDREGMIAVLGKAAMPREVAEYTVDQVLADPRRFGF